MDAHSSKLSIQTRGGPHGQKEKSHARTASTKFHRLNLKLKIADPESELPQMCHSPLNRRKSILERKTEVLDEECPPSPLWARRKSRLGMSGTNSPRLKLITTDDLDEEEKKQSKSTVMFSRKLSFSGGMSSYETPDDCPSPLCDEERVALKHATDKHAKKINEDRHRIVTHQQPHSPPVISH